MDVAKYIALFLLKNKYCHLQALGNLEIRKSSSVNNGRDLTGRMFIARLDQVGSIDDQLPLFIAVQEKISVSRASALVADFVTYSKSQLQSGSTITIPGIGKYTMKNGKIHFELDSYFSLPEQNIPLSFFNSGAPILTADADQAATSDTGTSKDAVETFQQYNNYNAPPKINWNAIGFWGLAVLILLSIVAGVLKYTVFKDDVPSTVMVAANDVHVDSSSLLSPAMIDSNMHASDSVQTADSAKAPDSTHAVAPAAAPGLLPVYPEKIP
ncbi:MAG: hypothetical protein QM743_13115 [Chitinophagaceae bacterium]